MEKLSLAQIKYMLVIDRLSQTGAVRMVDIAKETGLSRPSVHKMIGYLCNMDMVWRGRKNHFSFTPLGQATISVYKRCMLQISLQMQNIFAIDKEQADEEAMAVAAALSMDTMEKIMHKIDGVGAEACCDSAL